METGPQVAPVRAKHAMVVSIHHCATDAGVAVLQQGGNAVDAAVAVGFALAVVLPQAGNIGGGGFMLIRPASTQLRGGKPTFLDYREKAPAGASANMYLDKQGSVVPKMSTEGAKGERCSRERCRADVCGEDVRQAGACESDGARDQARARGLRAERGKKREGCMTLC